MAIHKPVQLELATARQLLLARKDLSGRVLQWEVISTPSGLATGGERLRVDLNVLDHPLTVLATSNGHGGHQYILRRTEAAGNLARLCDDSIHGHLLHWHRFEDMPGLEEEMAPVSPPTTGGPSADATTLLVDFFAAGLNFAPNTYTIQGRML